MDKTKNREAVAKWRADLKNSAKINSVYADNREFLSRKANEANRTPDALAARIKRHLIWIRKCLAEIKTVKEHHQLMQQFHEAERQALETLYNDR